MVGAVTVKLNVVAPPGGTSAGRSTRLMPQVLLSCGFCAPRRYELVPPAIQTMVPLFLMVTDISYLWPPTIEGGATDRDSYVAALKRSIRHVRQHFAVLPWLSVIVRHELYSSGE